MAVKRDPRLSSPLSALESRNGLEEHARALSEDHRSRSLVAKGSQ